MEYDLEKLKEILRQTATRWMILKDVEEWVQGQERELREMLRVMRARKKISKRATDFYFEMKQIKEILGE